MVSQKPTVSLFISSILVFIMFSHFSGKCSWTPFTFWKYILIVFCYFIIMLSPQGILPSVSCYEVGCMFCWWILIWICCTCSYLCINLFLLLSDNMGSESTVPASESDSEDAYSILMGLVQVQLTRLLGQIFSCFCWYRWRAFLFLLNQISHLLHLLH